MGEQRVYSYVGKHVHTTYIHVVLQGMRIDGKKQNPSQTFYFRENQYLIRWSYMFEVLSVLIPNEKRIKWKITEKKSAKTPKIDLKRSDED